MRPAAGAAAPAATDLRSGPAASGSRSGSGCPRLIDGAVRLKGSILDDRSNDLTDQFDRGTGEHQEARQLRVARALDCSRPRGGEANPTRSLCTARRSTAARR